MPADRGTLTRRSQPAAQDQNGRQQPTAPAGRRPPSAPRERKPLLAALALLLIIGGALSAAYLVVKNNQRVAAVEIVSPVQTGQQIPFAALREVQIVPVSGLAYVPWSEAGQVSQFYAATGIPAGTLLSSAMVTRVVNLASGRDEVGLALKDGQLPGGLAIGDRVDVYQVSDSAQGCPGAPGSLLAPNAIVLGYGPPPAAVNDSAIDVRLAIYPADAGAVTCNAANGNVAIAVLPAGSRSGAGAGAGPSAPPPPARKARPRAARHPARPTAAPSPSATASPSATG
jgi:hypothetical protein